MILLGVTSLQSEVLRQVNKGRSYRDIATDLNISEANVIYEEMSALATLSRRWSKSERDVKQMLCGILLILLSILPVFEDLHIDRALRVKSSSSRTVRNKRDTIPDILPLDV